MLAKPEPTVSTLSAWTYRVTVKAACVARGTRGVGGAVRQHGCVTSLGVCERERSLVTSRSVKGARRVATIVEGWACHAASCVIDDR